MIITTRNITIEKPKKKLIKKPKEIILRYEINLN